MRLFGLVLCALIVGCSSDGKHDLGSPCPEQAAVLRAQAGAYAGLCERCGRPWASGNAPGVTEHVTKYDASGRGIFVLCEECWQHLTAPQRLPFYRSLWNAWHAHRTDIPWETIESAVLAESNGNAIDTPECQHLSGNAERWMIRSDGVIVNTTVWQWESKLGLGSR